MKRVRVGPIAAVIDVAVSPDSVNRTPSPSSVTGTVTFPETVLVPPGPGQAHVWRVPAVAAAGTVRAGSRPVGIRAA